MSLLLLILNTSIVTSTTDVFSVVKAIAPSEVEVNNIVPGGMCPGHFDLSPGEANLIFLSDLVLYHGYESWFKKVEDLRPGLGVVDLKTDGNWMIPEVYLRGALEIKNILKAECNSESKQTGEIGRGYERLKAEVDSLSEWISKVSKTLKGKKVVCNKHQKEFLESLGMKVVSVFSPGDEISLREISEVVRIGKEENVRIVVGNLQSGRKVGKTIAEELESKYVVLSNFPAGKSYKETLSDNINLLLGNLNDKGRKYK